MQWVELSPQQRKDKVSHAIRDATPSGAGLENKVIPCEIPENDHAANRVSNGEEQTRKSESPSHSPAPQDESDMTSSAAGHGQMFEKPSEIAVVQIPCREPYIRPSGEAPNVSVVNARHSHPLVGFKSANSVTAPEQEVHITNTTEPVVTSTLTISETPELNADLVAQSVATSDVAMAKVGGALMVRTSSLSSMTLGVPAVPEDNNDNLNNFSCGSLDLASAMMIEGDAETTRHSFNRKTAPIEHFAVVEGNKSGLSAMEWSMASLDVTDLGENGAVRNHTESSQMLDAFTDLTNDEVAAVEALVDSCRSMDLNNAAVDHQDSAAAMMTNAGTKTTRSYPIQEEEGLWASSSTSDSASVPA